MREEKRKKKMMWRKMSKKSFRGKEREFQTLERERKVGKYVVGPVSHI